MEPGQVHPRPGHQRRQAAHEFHWAEHHMCSSIVIGRLQGNKDSPLAIFTFGENAVGLDFLRVAKKASWLPWIADWGDCVLLRKAAIWLPWIADWGDCVLLRKAAIWLPWIAD